MRTVENCGNCVYPRGNRKGDNHAPKHASQFDGFPHGAIGPQIIFFK